ncbi:MAG: putative (di)nucleoside polyphosphate hydrolase [Pelagibacterales bacterium]|nr:putative (di)nucleoside polyphosphate hydrolase [Pelagibacterales bacterium]
MESKKILPLRIGVGIVLLNNQNNVFVGKRIDNYKNFWQMPQGGVNENEDFFVAAKRELKEETGIESIEIIKKINGWLEYDLPKNLLGKIWKGKYRGQKQKWFIMRFIGENKEINVKTKNPEFSEWKWIKHSNLTDSVVNFKLSIYKKIKEELNFLNFN